MAEGQSQGTEPREFGHVGNASLRVLSAGQDQVELGLLVQLGWERRVAERLKRLWILEK